MIPDFTPPDELRGYRVMRPAGGPDDDQIKARIAMACLGIWAFHQALGHPGDVPQEWQA